MTSHQDSIVASENTSALARGWARNAVLGIVREAGGQTVHRPVLRGRPDLDMTVTDAEPVAGLHAVSSLMRAARSLSLDYVRQARKDGHSWHEVGTALGLGGQAERDRSIASAAYDYAADKIPTGRCWIAWTCPTCHQTVIDNGPEAGHPADAEAGHEDGCPRLAAAIEDWEASW